VSKIHVFIKHIFRAAEKASPSPTGVVMALFSRELGYGFEALRIRVKIFLKH
jgi:hypothetical protein